MAKPPLGRFRKLQEEAQALLHAHELPLPDEANLTRTRSFLVFCARVYHSFVRNRCPTRAAALAYTNLLAVVPLLAVAVSVSASLLKSQSQQAIQDWIKTAITKVAPMLGLKEAGADTVSTVSSQIASFVSNFQSGKLGVSAVLAFIFVAISLLATIESTFNDIWGATRGRGWFARVVQYWAALTLGPLFLLSAVTVTTWAKISEHLIERLPLMGWVVPFVVPLVILSLGCSLLYLVMPNTKVQWSAALLGGLVAGGLLQLNSYFNVLYVSRVLTYKQIYGSMATLPLFLLGLYFSWLLVLLGAQVAYAFQNRRAYTLEKQAETIHQRGREFAACHLMAYIGLRFQTGGRPPTDLEIVEALRIPLRLVCQVLSPLLHAGLIVEVVGKETAYAPARPLADISLRDVLQALRTAHGQDLPVGEDPSRPIVAMEFEAVEQAWQQAAGALTLEDLVNRLTVHDGLVSKQGSKIAS